jgi:hypothetical protein
LNPRLPWEIIDYILLINNDKDALIQFKRFYTLLKTKKLYVIDILRTRNLPLIHYFFTHKTYTYDEILNSICIFTLLEEPIFTCLINTQNKVLRNVIIKKLIDFDNAITLKKIYDMGIIYDNSHLLYAKSMNYTYNTLEFFKEINLV